MDPRIRNLLKPAIINTMNGLELIARIVVEGFISGSNKSQAIGFGQEFSQYRNYEPGDDLRQLDWKMYARSERYFIKQAEIETNITVKFMLDASHSMAYEENDVSKFQYAKVMISALAYLARKQGDTFGLFIVNDKRITTLQPRYEHQQFMRFLHELVEAKPESTWNKNDGLERLFDHHGKEMIVFITDLYDDAQDIQQFIYRLKTRRNEVIVFHVLGENELHLNVKGSFTFQDLESGEHIKVDTVTARQAYTQRISEWMANSKAALLEKNILYHAINMNEPVDQALRNFLKVRQSLL